MISAKPEARVGCFGPSWLLYSGDSGCSGFGSPVKSSAVSSRRRGPNIRTHVMGRYAPPVELPGAANCAATSPIKVEPVRATSPVF
jgi:hypothetical protein